MATKRCPNGYHRTRGKCIRNRETRREKVFDEMLNTRPELHAYSDFDKELIRREIMRRERLGFTPDEVPSNETILRSHYSSRRW